MASLLNAFCSEAGLEINKDKSFLVFSSNTPQDLRTEMASLFQLGWRNKLGKYLGVLIDDHKDRKANFQALTDKWNSRLAGWKGRLLSQAGRLTLIKSTLNSDLTYPMASLLFTKAEQRKLEGIITNFFWGDRSDGKRSPHLLQTRILKLPRKLGGIGLRDISATNKALLAKSAWRFISEPNTLASKWSNHKYFAGRSDWTPKKTSRASFVWKGILQNIPLITNHLQWQIGNGRSVNLSSRFWVAPIISSPPSEVVADLIDHHNNIWDLNRLRVWYNNNQISNIIKLPISNMGLDDELIWTAAPNGHYSTKAGYTVLWADNWGNDDNISRRLPNFPWDDYWKLKVPHKLLLFGWKVILDVVPVSDTLCKHHIRVDNDCLLCQKDHATEDRDHLFLFCDFTHAVWFSIKPSFVIHKRRFHNLNCWLWYWFHKWKSNKEEFNEAWVYILVTLYQIWGHRNQVLWSGTKININGVVRLIENQVSSILSVTMAEGLTTDKPATSPALRCLSSGCTISNVSWLAVSMFKNSGYSWAYAIAGKGTNWTTAYSCLHHASCPFKKKKGAVDVYCLAMFLRSCLLRWNDCFGGHIFLSSSGLYRLCISRNLSMPTRPIIKDIQQFVKQKQLSYHNHLPNELDWEGITHYCHFPAYEGFCTLDLG